MRTLTAIALPITTFATLLAVVACGPAKDYVTVRQQPRSGISQAVESCQSGIKASTKNVQENKTVKFCRISEAATVDRTKEMKPELVDQAYYFEISRKSGKTEGADRLSIDVAVGLDLPVGLTKEQATQVKEQIEVACNPSMKSVFSRSVRGLNLTFNPAFEVLDLTTPGSGQAAKKLNELKLLKVETGSEYPAYEMQAFANGAKFYPLGEGAEMKRCKSISGGKSAIKDCGDNSFLAVNQKFCRQLTKMTGVWLGLADVGTERVACGLPAVEPTPAPTATPAPEVGPDGVVKPAAAVEAVKPPATSKFMKAATEEDPKKFFASVKLDLSELSTILTPACPAFATVTEPTPRPASARKVTGGGSASGGAAGSAAGGGSAAVIQEK